MNDDTPKNEQADKEWADLQRDLDALGEQLGSLRDHTAALGETVVANLESRYQDVRNRSLSFRNTTEAQFEAMRQAAMQQAAATQSSLTEASVKSAEMAKDTARQVWERSEPLRQGAQEVGQGFIRAWSEIAASFGKAADKIQTAAAQKPASSASEEGHKPN
jgi:predicted  nucleic acid-binding Zn-ribbon protein